MKKNEQNRFLPKIMVGLVVLVLTVAAFFVFSRQSVSTNITNQTVLPKLSIGDKVTISVELADTLEKRELGLSYRNSLPGNQGMLFVFSEPFTPVFWMKGMNFPLDMVWIGKDDTIVDITENVPNPSSEMDEIDLPRYSPKALTENVLEVNAGFVKKYGVEVGDKILVERNTTDEY